MKKRIPLVALGLLLTTGLLAQSRFVSTRGKDLIGPDGKPWLIRGTNLGNWLVPEGYMFKFKSATSPRLINEVLTELVGPAAMADFWKTYLASYITAADIHYLRQLGMNSIRVPFHYKLFTDEDYLGGRGEARGFRILDSLVSWCRREGLYVLLDMHCAPGGQTGDNIDDSWAYPFLFDSEASQEQIIHIWGRIAAHYRNEPVILGYDLLNEPIAHFFDTAHFNPRLEPLYRRITKAIRAVDKNHLLFLGGAQWDSNFRPFGPPFDQKLVYTFHKYWTAPTRDVIQDYLDFRDRYNVPVYCGETGENSDEWVEAFRKTLDENQVGWHFWPYKKMDNTAGIVTFDQPAGYSLVSAFADSSRAGFGEIRNNRPADREAVLKALQGFLENCRFAHCRPNSGYIRALGFREP